MNSSSHSIEFVSTSRADFDIVLPLYEAMQNDNRFCPRLVLTGHHNPDVSRPPDAEFLAVDNDGGPETLLTSLTHQYFDRLRKKNATAVFLLGDRFELMPILTSAIVSRTPIIHMSGGEFDVCYVIDTQVRNAISAAAHIHLVSHGDYLKRLVSLGEEQWRICVSGKSNTPSMNPADTNTAIYSFLESQAIQIREKRLVHCCYHPPTMHLETWPQDLAAIFSALDTLSSDYLCIWTGTNNDPGGPEIHQKILDEVAIRDSHCFFQSLGGSRYQSLLINSAFMIGNSSSGTAEASSFQLPVINVGMRQSGRLHGSAVLDVPGDPRLILEGIQRALDMDRTSISNPFDNRGFPQNALDHIDACLKVPTLMMKRLPATTLDLQRVPEWDDFYKSEDP